MNTLQNHWTQQEFLTYLLLYGAHANIHCHKEEKKHILSKVEYEVYHKTFKEFSSDNCYEQIQKLIIFQKLNPYLSTEYIVQELQDLFFSEGHFHAIEKFVLGNIQRLLRRKLLTGFYESTL